MTLQFSLNRKSADQAMTSHDLLHILTGPSSRAGVAVNEKTALQTAAALCAARVLAEGVAQVPFKVYRQEIVDGKSYKHEARDHWAWNLLRSSPNEWMTSFQLRETMMYHTVFTGNGYCFKNVGAGTGQVKELIPLLNVKVEQDEDWGLTYTAYDKKGVIERFRPDQIVHFRGPSWNGFNGLNMINLAREALGLTEALQNAQSRLQAKGGQPPGFLTNEGEKALSPEARERLRASWNDRYGPNGEGGVAILDGAWKYVSTSLKAVDSQHIESRRFQIEEVARFFRVFPQMLMQADKSSTYASAEQFFIAHVVHSLGPWFERFEQTFQQSVLFGENVECEFVVNGLLRGAAKDRGEYNSRALGSGGAPAWMTQNEVRRHEGLNPIQGGDELPKPVAMTATPAKTETDKED
ncbi:MAG: phage portal protein [Cohaesibacter sp.]|nr:phage portal protein [Cohaesibacter sp.]